MRKAFFYTSGLLLTVALFSSCSMSMRGMQQANTLVELTKDDFTLSDQVTGTGSQTKILGIDWARLLSGANSGVIESSATSAAASPIAALTPIIGMVINPNKNSRAYALYDLMEKNPGYDAVFYPTFEETGFRLLGTCIYCTSTSTVRARLGKLNK